MKSTIGDNVINMRLFVLKCFAQLFSSYKFDFVMFWRKNISAKAAHKMLMKLATGHAINRVVENVKSNERAIALFNRVFNKYNAI